MPAGRIGVLIAVSVGGVFVAAGFQYARTESDGSTDAGIANRVGATVGGRCECGIMQPGYRDPAVTAEPDRRPFSLPR